HAPLIKSVPANVRHRQAGCIVKACHSARYQAEPFHASVFIAALKQHVQAQADAKKWAALLQMHVQALSDLHLSMQSQSKQGQACTIQSMPASHEAIASKGMPALQEAM
ncbi:hypothetical protein MMC29_001360, partial [Sticta canariensis]|nr:hypothetical protein [Sticta canariensis]